MKYPKFCQECWKVEECKQKVFMLAGTEPMNGFAHFEACEHYCADCLPTGDSAPIDDEEIDSPAHCADCGVPLIHRLTGEGVQYVKDAIEEGDGCCIELWPTVWADYLN